jgi:hypothetical protein
MTTEKQTTKQRRKAQGLCPSCGADPEGRHQCRKCAEKAQLYRAGRRTNTEHRETSQGTEEEAAIRFRVLFGIGPDPEPEGRYEDSPACQRAISELGPMKLAEVAYVLGGISRERVRQIEVIALRKLRKACDEKGYSEGMKLLVAEAENRGSVQCEPTASYPSRMHFMSGESSSGGKRKRSAA